FHLAPWQFALGNFPGCGFGLSAEGVDRLQFVEGFGFGEIIDGRGHVTRHVVFVARGPARASTSAATAATMSTAAATVTLLQVPIIGRFHVRHVQEAVAADAEVDEG